jgi:nucleoside-diphosphate-sugar epimerase
MNHPTIAVFGASGEIGSRLVLTLLQRGFKVRVFVRNSVGPQLGRLPVDALDIRRMQTSDPKKMTEDLNGIEIVINTVIDKKPYANKSEQVNKNHFATEMIVTAAREAGVKRFIHLSSIVAAPAKLTAEVLANPHLYSTDQDWYTLAKIDSEKVVEQTSGDMKYVIIRPGIVYGQGLAWSAVAFMRSRQFTIKLPKLSDATCHAIQIDDLVDLIISTIDRPQPASLIYGISPEVVSWADFYQQHAQAAGLEAKIDLVEMPELITHITTEQPPSFFQRTLYWIMPSPFLAPLAKIGAFARLAAQIRERVTPLSYNPIPNEPITKGPLWPASSEAQMYSSNARLTDRDCGQEAGFRYTRTLTAGAKMAAIWWLAQYSELDDGELDLIKAVKTSISL